MVVPRHRQLPPLAFDIGTSRRRCKGKPREPPGLRPYLSQPVDGIQLDGIVHLITVVPFDSFQ